MLDMLMLLIGLTLCDGTETATRAVEACEQLYVRTASTSSACEFVMWPRDDAELQQFLDDEGVDG